MSVKVSKSQFALKSRFERSKISVQVSQRKKYMGRDFKEIGRKNDNTLNFC